jgi:hypothetical protein
MVGSPFGLAIRHVDESVFPALGLDRANRPSVALAGGGDKRDEQRGRDFGSGSRYGRSRLSE